MFYIAKRYFRGHSVCEFHISTIENKFKAMTEENKPKLLAGDEALDLWRRGRKAWNNWIEENPGTDISFAGVDFSNEPDFRGELSFAAYNFGDSDVNFCRATFGDGNVNFSRATFGDGDVNFSRATFGDGDVNFSRATFGDGNVSFRWATFGDGNVNFSRATFGDGNVSFRCATFGDGNVNFSSTTLNTGKVTFYKTSFGDCFIDLGHAKFSSLIVRPKSLRLGKIRAEGLSVESLAIFDFPLGSENLRSMNFLGSAFGGPLYLKGKFGIIPDLRVLKSSHQIELSGLKVKLHRSWKSLSWPPKLSRVSTDREDGSRLRRLKEIAETNKDHQAALRFSADENRARRWIETSWFGSVLDMTFSACSNYGQSILRPFAALSLLAAFSVGLYKKLAAATFTAWWTDPGWGQSLLLSISNSLPFLPQSRDLRTDALKALYPGDPGFWVDALMITQGVLSFVFLFLIGLGLRNRFRL